MIKTITGGPGIIVHNGTPSGPYINMGMPSAGIMRYNGSNQTVEVYDGHTWIMLSSGYPSIQIDGSSIDAIEWAKKKRNEELELERLAQTSPAIKDLVNQIKEKQEQIKIIQTLLKEEVKV